MRRAAVKLDFERRLRSFQLVDHMAELDWIVRVLGAVQDEKHALGILRPAGGVTAERAMDRDIGKERCAPKIRDEILEDAAALGGKGFSAHFGQQRWLVSRQPALRAIFSRYGWDFRGVQTQICRWRLIVRVPKSTTSARDHDVSGMAPPSRMMRAHRSRIVANISNMAAPICKKICRPWRTILPAV